MLQLSFRRNFLLSIVLCSFFLSEVWAQKLIIRQQIQIAQPVPAVQLDDDPEDPNNEKPVDQKTADLKLIGKVDLKDEPASMLGFFKTLSVSANTKEQIEQLINQLGVDDFDKRVEATQKLVATGVPAINLLKNAAKNNDAEIAWRAEYALAKVEQVPTSEVSRACIRLLRNHKSDDIIPGLMAYFLQTDEESVKDEIRESFVLSAVTNGKPNAALESWLQSKDAIKRLEAALAFTKTTDQASRARMKAFLKSETDPIIRFKVTVILVEENRDKSLVASLIEQMGSIQSDEVYLGEDLLWRLAGETGPTVSFSGDAKDRTAAQAAWKQWWESNEAKVDMAKLSDDASFGLLLVLQTPLRGGLGQIAAYGSDNKEKWKVPNLNWPTDCKVLPGKKILIAEHNRSRVFLREISGKELWTLSINNPVNCGMLPNGVTWAVGRNQIIEWDKGENANRKQLFSFIRNEYDIVAGARTPKGEYLILTQQGQVIQIDRQGKSIKTINVGGGVNYYSDMQVLKNNSVLVTLQNRVVAYDMTTGKSVWTGTVTSTATSVQRLRTGNTLVGIQGQGKVVELDKDGKATKWEHTSSDAAFRVFKAYRQ
ncbi:MAG: PQQ-binding-like beta-propeller repeat protein [Zavarzinella sp.]